MMHTTNMALLLVLWLGMSISSHAIKVLSSIEPPAIQKDTRFVSRMHHPYLQNGGSEGMQWAFTDKHFFWYQVLPTGLVSNISLPFPSAFAFDAVFPLSYNFDDPNYEFDLLLSLKSLKGVLVLVSVNWVTGQWSLKKKWQFPAKEKFVSITPTDPNVDSPYSNQWGFFTVVGKQYACRVCVSSSCSQDYIGCADMTQNLPSGISLTRVTGVDYRYPILFVARGGLTPSSHGAITSLRIDDQDNSNITLVGHLMMDYSPEHVWYDHPYTPVDENYMYWTQRVANRGVVYQWGFEDTPAMRSEDVTFAAGEQWGTGYGTTLTESATLLSSGVPTDDTTTLRMFTTGLAFGAAGTMEMNDTTITNVLVNGMMDEDYQSANYVVVLRKDGTQLRLDQISLTYDDAVQKETHPLQGPPPGCEVPTDNGCGIPPTQCSDPDAQCYLVSQALYCCVSNPLPS